MYSRSKNSLHLHRGFAVLFGVLCLLREAVVNLKHARLFYFSFVHRKQLSFPTISKGRQEAHSPRCMSFFR